MTLALTWSQDQDLTVEEGRKVKYNGEFYLFGLQPLSLVELCQVPREEKIVTSKNKSLLGKRPQGGISLYLMHVNTRNIFERNFSRIS